MTTIAFARTDVRTVVRTVVHSAVRASLMPALVIASATDATAQDKDQLEKCDTPIGTIALTEPPRESSAYLAQYQLGSPTSLLRMIVQKSNCFVVLERGAGMTTMKGERGLVDDGEGQAGSNMGKGQMVIADFVLNPAVQGSDANAGGAGGAVGGLLGRKLGIGGVAGGMKKSTASTTILIADARTSVQVAADEGQAQKTNFTVGMFGYAGVIGGAGGAYTSTAQGKVIAASFFDNYNNIVKQLKSNPRLMARASRFDVDKAMGDAPTAGAVYNDGDVVAPKIDNVKLLQTPSDAGRPAATLKKGEELVVIGAEQNGYVKVQSAAAEGWVKKTLVAKR